MRYSILTLLIAATLIAVVIVAGGRLWAVAPETTKSVGWGILTMWGILSLHRIRRHWEIPGALPAIMVFVLGVFALSLAFLNAPNLLALAAGWGLGVWLNAYGYKVLEWGLLKSGVESDVSR